MQSIPKPMVRNGNGMPLSSANCNLNFENKLNIKERNVDDAAAAAALEFVFFSHPSDCRRFFFCQTTIPRPLECEQHLAFDLETLSCIDKSLVPRWYTTRRPIIIPKKTMTINLKHKIFIDIQFQLKGSGHVYSRPRLASHWAYTNYTTKCRPSMDAKMKRTKQIQEI